MSSPQTRSSGARLRRYGVAATLLTVGGLGLSSCHDVPVPGPVTTDTLYDAIDKDGDGEGAATDCNDNDPSIHPGAPESCNGIDDNCDGVVDEEVRLVYWRDADGDTFGNPTAPLAACEQPAGYVVNDDDCNDFSDAAFPGAEEVCDGLDNDCDGSTDDIPGFWPDADADGFGGAGDARSLCEPMPDGYADNRSDCDDTDPLVYPGAPELCADGVDHNCDGLRSCVSVEVALEGSEEACTVIWALEEAETTSWDESACEGCDYRFSAELELSIVLGASVLCADANDLSTRFDVEGDVITGDLAWFASDGWVGSGGFAGGVLSWSSEPLRVGLGGGAYALLVYGGELDPDEVATYSYGYYYYDYYDYYD